MEPILASHSLEVAGGIFVFFTFGVLFEFVLNSAPKLSAAPRQRLLQAYMMYHRWKMFQKEQHQRAIISEDLR